MTRINVVPPSELCDQHLLAEFRELTRIPNAVVRGKYNLQGQPKEYTLGAGHVKFFYDKLAWLHYRYHLLTHECWRRKFKVTYIFPPIVDLPNHLWNGYIVTDKAVEINRARIAERMPAKPRFTNSVR